MKKRLLAVLTVVLLLCITAVSSFAMVPNRYPLLKQLYPEGVNIYPQNATQNYNNNNYQLWYPTTCYSCGRSCIYTKIISFNEWYNIDPDRTALYIRNVDGLYTIGAYENSDNNILIRINYDYVDGGYINNYNLHNCVYNENKNVVSNGDVFWVDGEASIVYHIPESLIGNYTGITVNRPICMAVFKYYQTFPFDVENNTYNAIYGSWKNYADTNAITLGYNGMSDLAYNTIVYSIYDKTIEDYFYDAYNRGYNQGNIEGQATGEFFDNGMDNLFERFFDGFEGFIDDFTSLGWGTLTIGALLGFIGVVVITLLLIKIIRGM